MSYICQSEIQWVEQRIRFLFFLPPLTSLNKTSLVSKITRLEVTLPDKMFTWKRNSKPLKAKGNERESLRLWSQQMAKFLVRRPGWQHIPGWRLGAPALIPPGGSPHSTAPALTAERAFQSVPDVPPWMVPQFHEFKHQNIASEGKQHQSHCILLYKRKNFHKTKYLSVKRI